MKCRLLPRVLKAPHDPVAVSLSNPIPFRTCSPCSGRTGCMTVSQKAHAYCSLKLLTYSFWLRCFSPCSSLAAAFSSFRSQLRCHRLREAFPDHLSYSAPLLSLDSRLFFILRVSFVALITVRSDFY